MDRGILEECLVSGLRRFMGGLFHQKRPIVKKSIDKIKRSEEHSGYYNALYYDFYPCVMQGYDLD